MMQVAKRCNEVEGTIVPAAYGNRFVTGVIYSGPSTSVHCVALRSG